MISANEKDIEYLRSLESIRERCNIIYELGLKNKLNHFSIQLDKLPEVVQLVRSTIDKNYVGGIETVKFHSRWRHFEPGNPNRVKEMTDKWQCDSKEKCRRLIDLAMISVLLDAGAGDKWRFKEPGTNNFYNRSEGLGIASFHMFCNGAFSSDKQNPFQVDAQALLNLSNDSISKGFQVTTDNPLVGCEGRTSLLKRLGMSLQSKQQFFKLSEGSYCRPGFLTDYLVQKVQTAKLEVSIHSLWHVIITGLQDMWPEGRTRLHNCNMGDVWPHSKLPQDSESSKLVSFHKLSQWLTYSLIEPLQEAGYILKDLSAMTGLPEYRNGGLFIDLGVLVPNESNILVDQFEPSSEVIVEWRALTVILLDKAYELFRSELQLSEEEFPLVKFLEGGSWKAGRVIASQLREKGVPPIQIKSDGTVF